MRTVIAGALAAAVAGGAWGWWWQGRAAELATALAAAEARTAAATQALRAAEATIAAQSAHLARIEADAARADALRRTITEAPDADVPVPDWLRDLPDRLRGGAAGRPVNPR